MNTTRWRARETYSKDISGSHGSSRQTENIQLVEVHTDDGETATDQTGEGGSADSRFYENVSMLKCKMSNTKIS